MPRRTFAAVAFAFGANGLMFGAWAARIPAIKAQTGLDSAQLGFAILCAGVGATVAMSFAGLLAARLGSHVMTAATLVGCALLLPAVGGATSFVALGGALLFFGALQGSMDVCMNANGLAVERSGGGPIMSRLHGCWSLGSFIGAAVSGVAASAGLAVQLEFGLLGAGLLVPAAALRLTMLPDRHAGDGAVLRRPPRRVLALGLLAFLGFLAEGSAGDWSALFMRDSVGTSEQEAALALAAFSGAMATARFAGDRLTAFAGPSAIVGWGAALAAAGLGLAIGVGLPLPSILGFTLMGLGLAAIVPTVFRAGGSQPGVPPGVGIAAVSTLGYAGGLVGPPLIGSLAGLTGLRVALGVVVALLVVVALGAPRAVRGVRGPELAVVEELP